jgi:hypothetical protein
MPIEIKEMHIKINVDEGKGSGGGTAPSGGGESVIQECLEQVAKMLNDKNER